MKRTEALAALSALSQATRLDIFRLLVRHEPEGLPAGEIARALGVPHNTMSTHLRILAQAGLATHERRSRSITYRASLAQVGGLVRFLVEDCCNGDPALCAPIIAEIAPEPS